MRAAVLFSALALVACGGSEPPGTGSEPLEATGPGGEPGDQAGSTRASRERAEAEARAGATVPPGDVAPSIEPTPSAAPRPIFVALPSDAREGEDGRGAVVAADRPIALELDARRFPPRALDPVLLVGPLRFERYDHPAPGRLRFVAASRALLPEGAPVAVQYGDDAATRTVVSESLALPPEGAR